jgi:hypothetical protein
MSLIDKIEKGKTGGPFKAVIYGEAGIGKTTLASQLPKPLFLDTEDGTKKVGPDRLRISTWDQLQGYLISLGQDLIGYETIVIDSADWAERMATDAVILEGQKKSIEDFGFGKGHIHVKEKLEKMLAMCDQIVRAGASVVFVAHSKVVRVSPPDQTDGYDRYELKLSKHGAPVLKEWSDAVLFCHYQTRVVQGADGRNKAKGGKERVIHTERSAAWDAKNRFGLADEIPLTVDSLSPMISSSCASTKPEPPDVEAVIDKIRSSKSEKALGSLSKKIEAKFEAESITKVEFNNLKNEIDNRLHELKGASLEHETAG